MSISCRFVWGKWSNGLAGDKAERRGKEFLYTSQTHIMLLNGLTPSCQAPTFKSRKSQAPMHYASNFAKELTRNLLLLTIHSSTNQRFISGWMKLMKLRALDKPCIKRCKFTKPLLMGAFPQLNNLKRAFKATTTATPT